MCSEMGVILKAILELLEQNASGHLTRMETSSINTFKNSRAEHTQPSANVGLPGDLIQCHLPQRHCAYPAYVTYTAPVVKMLVEQQAGRKRATASCPTATEQSTASPGAATARTASVPSTTSRCSSSEGAEGSAGKAVPESSLPPPSACSRVIFARKAPLHVAPSGKKK